MHKMKKGSSFVTITNQDIYDEIQDIKRNLGYNKLIRYMAATSLTLSILAITIAIKTL